MVKVIELPENLREEVDVHSGSLWEGEYSIPLPERKPQLKEEEKDSPKLQRLDLGTPF